MSKQSLALFIVFFLSTVAFVSAIPQDDLPETSYNESDTPVNQPPQVVPGARFVSSEAAEIVSGININA
jgi:hypothetical protein